MFSTNNDYEILTPHGWIDFAGVLLTGEKELHRVVLKGGSYVDATAEHTFFTNQLPVTVQQLKIGDSIDTISGLQSITSITSIGSQLAYDIIEVSNIDHSFVVNDAIITKNCDETAFVRPSIQQEFWASISPTLATGGKLFMTSTPNGDSDLFASLWRGATSGTNGMAPLTIKWNQVPGRDEAFKKNEIAKNGILKWSQEFECALLSSDPLLIDSMKAAQLKSTEPITQEIGVKIWRQFEKQDKQTYQQPSMADNYNLHNGWHNPLRMQKTEVLEYEKQCIITVDPSKGVNKDFTVVEVFSYPELDQMMELRSNKSKTGDIYIALKRIWEKAHDAGWQVFFTVENNGVGEGLIALFENDSELPDNVELVSEVGQVGLNTSRKSKALGCKVFKEFVESGKLKLHSKILIEEIKNFVLVGGSYEAKEGSTDDCVMSTVLACRVVHQLAAYDDQAFDMLYSVEESEESIHEFDNEGDDNEGGSDYDEMPMVF